MERTTNRDAFTKLLRAHSEDFHVLREFSRIIDPGRADAIMGLITIDRHKAPWFARSAVTYARAQAVAMCYVGDLLKIGMAPDMAWQQALISLETAVATARPSLLSRLAGWLRRLAA